METIKVGKNEKIKSINEAISLAKEGSTILLVDDYYFEKVIVNKSNLTITSKNNSLSHITIMQKKYIKMVKNM